MPFTVAASMVRELSSIVHGGYREFRAKIAEKNKAFFGG